jgi:molecular chaperone HscB
MDPFATLGVERTFDLDLRALEKTHRELSRALHPDRFVQAGAAERRMALAKAQTVNEAWRTLRDPVRRAEALFALAGIAVGETREPRPSQAFLMDVLEQREALAEARAARDMKRVHAMAEEIRARQDDVETALRQGFSRGADAALVEKLGELRFHRRFLEEVSAIEDELDHGLAGNL